MVTACIGESDRRERRPSRRDLQRLENCFANMDTTWVAMNRIRWATGLRRQVSCPRHRVGLHRRITPRDEVRIHWHEG
jgi:hypothetical protein